MSAERPPGPDIEAGAEVRMKRVRFEEDPEVETSTHLEPGGKTRSESERENLPKQVEAGKTYRNARIRKQVEIRLQEDENQE